ncbi:MAG: glycoside hydrolase family 88 protein [Cyclobacteriaceae bacterium]
MRKIKNVLFTGFCLLTCTILITSCKEKTTSEQTDQLNPIEILDTIADRLYGAVQSESSPRLPRSVEEGKVRYTSPEGWTSGFFPGMLWMMESYDTSRDWSKHAALYTEELEKVQFLTSHHDLGFMLFNSYGRGYVSTQSASYKQVLVNGANSLAFRYDSMVGMIKSWDRPGIWQYPVIIDNMMNLEYLFWATKATGDSSYYDMAVSHAAQTLRDHYRDDMSCYHVVDYDTLNGEPIWKGTHQGLADESVWARGQAWGLYGFTMAYRETGDLIFLEQAKKIAAFLLNHEQMPADKVPYWDFSDPEIPDSPRDVSAAAIIASGLIELSTYVPAESTTYQEYAKEILLNLSENYRYKASASQNFFYLDQSVGNKPKDKEVSIPIIYADYYFIEALLRLKQLEV